MPVKASDPVSPLLKNQDSRDNLKRAIDKRPKKVPMSRTVATRPPSVRDAGRRSGGSR